MVRFRNLKIPGYRWYRRYGCWKYLMEPVWLGIEISKYRGIVGIVGMAVENTWWTRYGKISKSQNAVVSLVSCVWHLKIPAPRWYGRWTSQIPVPGTYLTFNTDSNKRRRSSKQGEGSPLHTWLPFATSSCFCCSYSLVFSLHVHTWKMTIAWFSSRGWECAATSWLKIYIHSPKIWSRMMEFITRTHKKKNRLEFWYILKTRPTCSDNFHPFVLSWDQLLRRG